MDRRDSLTFYFDAAGTSGTNNFGLVFGAPTNGYPPPGPRLFSSLYLTYKIGIR
jgi:hypothetical protein